MKEGTDILRGEWEIKSLYVRILDRWELYENYTADCSQWHFLQHGILMEYVADRNEHRLDYVYYPESNELRIARSICTPDELTPPRSQNKYVVEQTSPNEIWLYSLKDPEFSDYKIMLKRVKSTS